MSGGFIAILGLEAVVFAAWGFHAFRCLFKLLGRAVAETGHPLPGIRVGLHMFRIFATAPVVPVPKKGSSTTSPGLVDPTNTRCSNDSGFCVG